MAQADKLLSQVAGRYWAYDNSVWDKDHNVIYTFVERVNEGQVIAKGSGILLDNGGIFREVADPAKIGGKPCTGTWEAQQNDVIKVACGGKTWYYHLLQLKEGNLVLSITNSVSPHAQTKDKASSRHPHK